MLGRGVRYVMLWMGATLALAACANLPAPSPTPTALQNNALGGFPFPPGTTWVYSREEYQQVIGDPTTLITATRLFTETVVPPQISPRTAIFALDRTVSEDGTPPGWGSLTALNPGEYWYQIQGNQLFSVILPGGQKGTLLYDFPLVVGKNWCPQEILPDGLPSCHMNGLRIVENRTSYITPVGTFDDCYEIEEEYNSGGIREWFCNGVGTVARKYDHSGSRFGFQDALIRYTRGPDR